VILTRTKADSHAVDRFVRRLLAEIGLEVAESKSGVRRVSDRFEFLGFSFGRSLRPRPAALMRFKDDVRSRPRRTAPVSLERMIDELNPVLRGWGNYFAQGDVISLFGDLDKWIRERLRSQVRGSKARLVSRSKLPTRRLDALELVRLETFARARRLSPV
jgi:RNA-directed DNA polymerase